MTTSESAFVWVWLPGATAPVVAGRLDATPDGRLHFTYGQSYLGRSDAIAIYDPELPLRRGVQAPRGIMRIPSCIRDASPDAWGRRVILNRLAAREDAALGELAFLLNSGSDRPGALDFQTSATDHVPREGSSASLDALMEAADRVVAGLPLTPALDAALLHGTSIGGARPKATISDGGGGVIAKFGTSADTYGVVQAEFLAMRLAQRAGLDVAPVRFVRAAGRPVLLVERFDRRQVTDGWLRRAMVSALTILGLDEMEARYASYGDLAEQVRLRFTRPKATLAELFGRLVFNILCGNTDDHARNHAGFWDGRMLTLTPAYDICPQLRSGGEASQAMLVHGADRRSRIATCLSAAGHFGLGAKAAVATVEQQLDTIRRHWRAACDEGALAQVERRLLMGRSFLNRYAFEDLATPFDRLGRLAGDIRAELGRD